MQRCFLTFACCAWINTIFRFLNLNVHKRDNGFEAQNIEEPTLIRSVFVLRYRTVNATKGHKGLHLHSDNAYVMRKRLQAAINKATINRNSSRFRTQTYWAVSNPETVFVRLCAWWMRACGRTGLSREEFWSRWLSARWRWTMTLPALVSNVVSRFSSSEGSWRIFVPVLALGAAARPYSGSAGSWPSKNGLGYSRCY